MRHIPDFVIYLTGLVSTIFFVFCGIFFTSNKTVGVWTLYGGLIFGLLTGFLYWQNDIWKTQIKANKSSEAQTDKTEKMDSPVGQMSSQETPPQKSNNKEKKMEGKSKPVIIAPNSVISIDQKGGITAHTVNLAPQARRVTPEQRAILLRALKPLSLQSIKISYGEADPEQKQFAEDLIEALRAAGCVFEVSSALHMITPYEKGLTFEVNSTPPYPRGSDTLQKALNEAHIDSQWVGTPDMKRDVIWMVVGKQ